MVMITQTISASKMIFNYKITYNKLVVNQNLKRHHLTLVEMMLKCIKINYVFFYKHKFISFINDAI